MTSASPISGARSRPAALNVARLVAAYPYALYGLLLTVVLLTAFQYALPRGCDAISTGLNLDGARFYQTQMHLNWVPRLGLDAFNIGGQCLVMLQWGLYALVVAAGYYGAKINRRAVLGMTLGLGLFVAVFFSPLLSTDIYGYALYGRMAAYYGQNPYVTLPEFMAKHHDPAAQFMDWNLPMVYGPVWALLNIGLVALFKSAGLLAQIIALKGLEAGALLLAAWAGGRLAERLEPGRGALTTLAIGLNPLFLTQGPGTGHNDLLTVALLLAAALFFTEKKYAWAGLFLGLSVGVKVITLAALPWLCLLLLMRRHRDGTVPQGLARAGTLTLATLLPTVIGYLPLWAGPHTLVGATKRTQWRVPAAALKREILALHFLTHHHITGAVLTAGVLMAQHADLIIVFLLGTLWVARSADKARWLTVWIGLAAFMMLFTFGMPFPSYLLWFWPLCLTRWDRLHWGITFVCLYSAVLYTSQYYLVTVTVAYPHLFHTYFR